ncbi:uncharacterized protein LOC131230429 [Magnolia sinica]|uniref:uncharacterized protein LOC131230429 n=1 Tax=Magnolia sinica TaxID=86752 RepID=UPI002659787E|nr:uncharacterized protein LOC131230429 [Magnolia sinica]
MESMQYLGVPVGAGRKKSADFQRLLDKVDCKIRGWQSRCLTQVGRVVLLQNVVSSIPLHMLAAASVPSAVLKALESSLWGSFMATTYGRDLADDGGTGRGMTAASPVWRKIRELFPYTESQVIWQVGRGDRCLWKTNWTGLGPLESRVTAPIPATLQGIQIRDFLGNARPLPPSAVPSFLSQETINFIFHKGFCTSKEPVSPIWPFFPDGQFSVKTTWDSSRRSRPRVFWAKQMWHTLLPPKISLLTWRCIQGVIPVESVVQAQGVSLASQCVYCDRAAGRVPGCETSPHLFLLSDRATAICSHFVDIFSRNLMTTSSIEDRLRHWWNGPNLGG